jgi:hypothetical protein
MATTTPNYGWTVPTSTDLVKDGATAIETLGDAIDASMNTALGTKKAGMVLLNTTSFSAVSSQSVNDVFSATYTNYKIIVNQIMSTAGTINLRLRVSGTDASGNNYKYAAIGYNSNNSALNNYSGSGADVSSFETISQSATTATDGITVLNILNPFETKPTFLSGKLSRFDSTGIGILGDFNYTGRHSLSTSYTGFTILTSTGTTTGSVSVYGYNK